MRLENTSAYFQKKHTVLSDKTQSHTKKCKAKEASYSPLMASLLIQSMDLLTSQQFSEPVPLNTNKKEKIDLIN